MFAKKDETTGVEKAKAIIKKVSSRPLKPGVSAKDQDAEIQSLKETVQRDKFFFVVDRPEGKLEHIYGVAKWLGYDETAFNLETYLSIIHEAYLEFLIHLVQVTTEFANSKDFKIGFRQHHYVVNIALKHAEGHYVWCKRSLSAWQWQYDQSKQIVTHYMNEFTVIDPYVIEITAEMSPRIIDAAGKKLHKIEELIRQKSLDSVENQKKFFSTQELRILRKIAYQPDITSKEIAQSFKTKVSTIHTLNKRIIEKGRAYFPDDSIHTTRDLALLLKRNFIV